MTTADREEHVGAGDESDARHEHPDGDEHDAPHEHGGGPLGHSHDPADLIDDALAASGDGIRAVKVSLVGLGATGLAQMVVVAISGSVALLADTVHNVTDALTAIPLWIAFVVGRRRPTKRFSYGYERVEDLAGVFIVLVIAASAVFAGWEAIGRLRDPQPLEHLPWVIGASIVGFAGNEFVAAYRIRIGRRIGSAALVADGHHARADGVTSLGVLAGAIGVALGFERADPIAGLVITAAIVVVLWQAGASVFHRVLDGTDDATVPLLESVAARVEGVRHVTSVKARWTGHALNAELEVQVDGDLTVERAHRIAEEVEHELLHAVPRLRGATVHVDPHDHDGHYAGPMTHHRSTPDEDESRRSHDRP